MATVARQCFFPSRAGENTVHSDIMTLPDPLYALSGFVVGLLVGQTGVGGGSLMTPLLVLLFGVHPATAVGTDLLYAAASKSVGTLVHGANHTVDWRVVGRLARGSVPATMLTLLVLSQFNIESPAMGAAISFVLGIALLMTGGVLMLRRQFLATAAPVMQRITPRARLWLTIGCGAVLGVLVSISSVGAGAIGVTALVLLYPEVPIACIVGSDIAHAVPLTLIAGAGHWWLGSVDWPLLGSLLTGSVPGIMLGSYLVRFVPEWVLRPLLAIVLFLVGGRLVF
jgi:uncharacterized membrane protein YfcA